MADGHYTVNHVEVVSGRLAQRQWSVPGRVHLVGAELVEVDFSALTLPSFMTSASTLHGCRFVGTRFEHGYLAMNEQSTFVECDFTNADLRHAYPGQARFVNCSFHNTRLDGWLCDAAEFVDCRFSGSVRSVQFYGAPPPDSSWVRSDGLIPSRGRNEFRGNDFMSAQVEDCLFIFGIDLDAQRWPAEGYVFVRDFPVRANRARVEIERWPESSLTAEALVMLSVYQKTIEMQRDLFAPRYDLYGPEIADAVWELLDAETPPQA